MSAETSNAIPGRQLAVPAWLANLAGLGWRVLVIAALGVVIWLLASLFWVVTASVAVAIVISAVFAPAVLRLRDRGRSRNASALIVWTLSMLALGLIFLVLAIAFLPYLGDLLRLLDSSVASFQAQISQLGLPPAVGNLVRSALEALRTLSGEAAGGFLASAASAATIIILAVFLVFFLLRDGDRAWLWFFQDVSDQKRENITAAGRDAMGRIAGYLQGTTILAAIVAVSDYVFMLILGIPLAFPLSVLAFFAAFIPYFGGLIATIAILLVALSANGTTTALVMLALIVVRNAIVAYGIRPTLYGRTVSIHPALVLVALPAGLEIAGVVGLFAAVPVTAFLLTVTRAAIQIVQPDPPPPTPALVPAWLDRLAQYSWRLLIVIGLGALGVAAVVVVPLVAIPVIGALIIAATLDPLVGYMLARGRSRTFASAVAVVGAVLAISAMLFLAVVALVANAPDVGNAVNSGASTVNQAAGGQLGLATDAVGEISLATVRAALAFGDELAAIGLIGVLSALLAFYFLRDGGRLWASILGLAEPSEGSAINAAGRRAYDALGGYMLGTAAISFVGAASQWLIMVILGIPLALPVFVLSFFLCFIPYIGGYISTGIALLLTIAVGSTVDVAIMFTWTMVFNIVQGNVIAPVVYSKTVNVHPAIVLLAIPAGAAVAGIAGMFIAVPVIGVVTATWRTVIGVLGTHSPRLVRPGGGDQKKTDPGPPADAAHVAEAPAPST